MIPAKTTTVKGAGTVRPRQLRDSEAERDRLRATVEGYQRAEVERLAAAKLHDGADVWRHGVTPPRSRSGVRCR